jgi:hypothetical protein
MTALQIEAPVYLAAVAHSRDGDHAGAVVNGIDHPESPDRTRRYGRRPVRAATPAGRGSAASPSMT